MVDFSQNYKVGRLTEDKACTFLEKKGYTILNRRYKSPYGEIDVIAQKNDQLIALEVKHRKTVTDGLFSISQRQKKRICQTLLYFLQDKDVSFMKIRFDVMIFSRYKEPIYIKNAWNYDEKNDD